MQIFASFWTRRRRWDWFNFGVSQRHLQRAGCANPLSQNSSKCWNSYGCRQVTMWKIKILKLKLENWKLSIGKFILTDIFTIFFKLNPIPLVEMVPIWGIKIVLKSRIYIVYRGWEPSKFSALNFHNFGCCYHIKGIALWLNTFSSIVEILILPHCLWCLQFYMRLHL